MTYFKYIYWMTEQVITNDNLNRLEIGLSTVIRIQSLIT